MAEAWHLFGDAQTSANEASHSIASTAPVTVGASESVLFDLTGFSMEVEHVEVSLSLSDSSVDVFLLSAAGTRVELYGAGDAPAGALTWTFGAEAFLGEAAEGAWALEFVNDGGAAVTVESYSVEWFGSADTVNDIYHYTDEMFAPILGSGAIEERSAPAEDAARLVLADSDGGTDWLNLSAMTGELQVDLRLGASSSADGQVFATLSEGVIENAVGGDNAANELYGMRGDDLLDGGAGDDLLSGGAGNDMFVFAFGSGSDVILDFTSDGGTQDLVALVGFGVGYDDLAFETVFTGDGAQDTLLSFASGDRLTFSGIDATLLTADAFQFYETAFV